MPRHIMIDIETWDTAPTAVIRAIALVGFSLDGTPQAMHLIDCRRTLDEQIQAGRTLSADTVRWWAGQPHPLDHLLEQTGQVAGGVLPREPATLDELLDDLHAVAGGADEHEETRVWSRGHFDVAILEDLFTRALRPVPWRHSHVRDARTMDEILPPTRAPLAHHPLADCLAQISHVCAALRLVAPGACATTTPNQTETT
jgi:hypothetical protein